MYQEITLKKTKKKKKRKEKSDLLLLIFSKNDFATLGNLGKKLPWLFMTETFHNYSKDMCLHHDKGFYSNFFFVFFRYDF